MACQATEARLSTLGVSDEQPDRGVLVDLEQGRGEIAAAIAAGCIDAMVFGHCSSGHTAPVWYGYRWRC
jgi:hypothetical protein